MIRSACRGIPVVLVIGACWAATHAQSPSPADTGRLGEMRWRMIGPHRASRTKAVDGVAGQPHTFFMGVVNGGVWKTTDAGRTWVPIFDDQPTGSIGSIAVAPSRPSVIYVGTGEGQQRPDLATGDGLYKSADGGQTWTHLGLRDTQQIAHIAVDPANPDRLFVAALGHPYGPNDERGIFRSLDGGQTFQKVLYKDENTGGSDVAIDPADPDTVYAVLWEARQGPWENGDFRGPGSGLFKSTDGGKTFTAFRGAPGGDDYQKIWINPTMPDVMIMTSDQGAVVTLNGGSSWSSWYNQPTAAFYHVTTDHAFPYRVCSGQQESGSVCISSRGDDGQITFREWHPVGVEEYGYVAPDPLDPDIVYGGKVSRFDRRTGQVQNVAPRPLRTAEYRVVRTMPLLFSPVNPRKLYFASNVLWQTTSGGESWEQISPDLTRKDWAVPANVGKYIGSDAARPSQRGVIYTIAPSYRDENTIWIGTDDGLIHVTRDGGKSWADVTPPQLTPWAKVSLMDASPFDAGSAYAAINTFRLDDLRPHIYRTRDGGKSWQHITAGIPDGGIINVVRADPVRRGLLFAGSEQAVYVSFDDGDRWQPLRLNMPATSIRDLIIKDDDLVVGTHGRSFWILDDITPLRQVRAETFTAGAHLFQPRPAWRFRWNKNTDTPLPPDEPGGDNPPDGAIVNYWLGQDARSPVTLEILDAGGSVVRRYSSADAPEAPIEGRNTPDYWLRPPQTLSAKAGFHRFVWDVHHERPAVAALSYPIAAIHANTPKVPFGSWALPGTYTVRLNVDGKTMTEPLVVRLDPRVKTSPAGMKRQYDTSRAIDGALRRVATAIQTSPANRDALERLRGQLTQLFAIVEQSDAAPVSQVLSAVKETLAAVDATSNRR